MSGNQQAYLKEIRATESFRTVGGIVLCSVLAKINKTGHWLKWSGQILTHSLLLHQGGGPRVTRSPFDLYTGDWEF